MRKKGWNRRRRRMRKKEKRKERAGEAGLEKERWWYLICYITIVFFLPKSHTASQLHSGKDVMG